MIEYASYIRRISNAPLDVHLMVQDIKQAVDDFCAVQPNIITFHLEACKDEEEVWKTIEYIKKNNCKVGISVKPNTNIEEIYKYLPYIHMCLVMTVEPGKGGQTYLSEMTQKVKTLKEYIDNNQIEIDIEVDGGIDEETVSLVKKAGCDIVVAGTYILQAKDKKEAVAILKKE